jgi:hypothetical protein
MITLYDGGRSVMKKISWVLSIVYGLPSFPAWKTLTGDELKARWILLRSIVRLHSLLEGFRTGSYNLVRL